LRIARGVQNKVLEAMAMARPVVATAQAAEGIRAEAGRDYILARGEADIAAAVLACLQSAGPSEAARACILENYDWDSNLAVVDGLFAPAAAAGSLSSTHAPLMELHPA
jgi:glycosyltransferase involved in cell wall biosynthesis